MNREAFIQSIQTIYEQCISIVRVKNQDYAGESDPFKNFRNATIAGVSVEQAILVRIMDKITRAGNLLSQEAAVKEETIRDTIQDAINYLAILLVYLETEKRSSPFASSGGYLSPSQSEAA